jgi:hypothetical protein
MRPVVTEILRIAKHFPRPTQLGKLLVLYIVVAVDNPAA